MITAWRDLWRQRFRSKDEFASFSANTQTNCVTEFSSRPKIVETADLEDQCPRMSKPTGELKKDISTIRDEDIGLAISPIGQEPEHQFSQRGQDDYSQTTSSRNTVDSTIEPDTRSELEKEWAMLITHL